MSKSEVVNLAAQAWLNDDNTRRVVEALNTGPETVRFVGGCVRDAVRDEMVKDVDLATIHQPEKVIQLLESKSIKAVPTGIGHGTITAVADGEPFEVTTLRTDVETFGRHAEVAFTNDWQADAERRDFTMNAIYADPDGSIFDPVKGVEDARKGLVRFIGDPDQRIQEDFLRILRFFRFNARFGHDNLDEQSLAACVRNKEGLAKLSGERIQSELFQLLTADKASPIVQKMHETGILSEIMPEAEAAQLKSLEGLIAVDKRHSIEPEVTLRLAALLPKDENALKSIAKRLKFSNEVRNRLLEISRVSAVDVESWQDENEMGRALYRLGQPVALDHLRLKWAEDGDAAHEGRWHSLLERAKAWSKSSLKIRARDVMSLGVEEGPDVGRILAQVEDWWIDHDFPDDRSDQLDQLKKIVVASG